MRPAGTASSGACSSRVTPSSLRLIRCAAWPTIRPTPAAHPSTAGARRCPPTPRSRSGCSRWSAGASPTVWRHPGVAQVIAGPCGAGAGDIHDRVARAVTRPEMAQLDHLSAQVDLGERLENHLRCPPAGDRVEQPLVAVHVAGPDALFVAEVGHVLLVDAGGYDDDLRRECRIAKGVIAVVGGVGQVPHRAVRHFTAFGIFSSPSIWRPCRASAGCSCSRTRRTCSQR